MAKRFTDSEKWADPWFCDLPAQHKLFWLFLLDNCDMAGMWKVNWPLVRFHLGKYSFESKYFDKRIHQIEEDRWYVPKFIEFQYGELSEDCNPHKPVIKILNKFGIDWVNFKGTNTLLGTLKAQDQDKDKDKEGVVGETKAEPKVKFSEYVQMTQGQYDQLAQKLGKTVLDEYVVRLNNYIGSKGKKYKSHYHTILSWTDKDIKTGQVKVTEKRGPPDRDCVDCRGSGYIYAPGSGKNVNCGCTKIKKEELALIAV